MKVDVQKALEGAFEAVIAEIVAEEVEAAKKRVEERIHERAAELIVKVEREYSPQHQSTWFSIRVSDVAMREAEYKRQ